MKLALNKIVVNGRHRRDMGDVESLARSIESVGLLHPVVVTKDNRLIAGERRMAAVSLLKWSDIPATVVDNLDDARSLLIAERDENVCRKEFTPSEAVAVGRLLEELERPKAEARREKKQGRPKKTGGNLPPVSKKEPKTRDKVASDVGLSGRTYEKAKAVVAAAEAEPEKFAPVVAEMDRTGKVDKAFRQVNAAKIEASPAPEIPTGTFDLILADPPWSYEATETESRHIENQYPTLSVEQICEIKPPAADDSVLFLWATAPLVPEALAAMKAWGFKYRTCAVWDKEKIGMGYWFRGQHELLLVGVKGKFSPPTQERRVSSVFRASRGKHSEKPDSVLSAIEAMFPKARRLEMFARSARDGWSAWGNQV